MPNQGLTRQRQPCLVRRTRPPSARALAPSDSTKIDTALDAAMLSSKFAVHALLVETEVSYSWLAAAPAKRMLCTVLSDIKRRKQRR